MKKILALALLGIALCVGVAVAQGTFPGLGTSTTVLHGNATGSATWAPVNLGTDVTGTLPAGSGGSGAGSFTAHSVLLGEGSSAFGTATIGTGGRFLIDQGAGNDPAFQSCSGDCSSISTAGLFVMGKLNGVTYPSGPSANTVPVVTSAASGGTVTYETVPNAALTNSSTTVNGVVCTLGGSCTITASAGTITVGSTNVASGVTNQLLYDNGGVLGEITKANNSVLATNGSGVPSWVTTLPSGLTAPSLTVTGAFTATGLVTNADLVNSSITFGSTAVSLGGTLSAVTARGSSGFNIDELTTHGDSAYTILSTDRVVATSTALTASRTWTLPAANSVNVGQSLVIEDQAGGVTAANTLVVARAGADTINGAATSITINVAFGAVELISDGTSKWTEVAYDWPFTASANNFLTGWSATTGFTQAQPSFGNLSGSATCAQLPALTGDTTTSAGSCTTTTAKVDGVSYPTGPGTNTVPVVTSSNTVTYEAVPNAALANSTITVNNGYGGTVTSTGAISLGGTGTLGATTDQLRFAGLGIGMAAPATGVNIGNAIVLPTGNGQYAEGTSTINGGIISGQGSTNDITVENKSGTTVCDIATGGTTWACNTLGFTNGNATITSAATGQLNFLIGGVTKGDYNISNANIWTLQTSLTLANGGNLFAGAGQWFGAPVSPSANSQSSMGATTTGGAVIIGQGSTNDFTLENKSGTSVCTVATGTTTLNCTGLQVGGSAVATGTITSEAASDIAYYSGATTIAGVSITGLVLGNGGSAPTAYGGTSCNSDVLTLSAAGAATCGNYTAHGVLLGEGNNVALATAATGTAGRLLIDQGAAADPSFNAMSQDCTITSAGVITCTKTNNVAFGALATLNVGTGLNSAGGNLNCNVATSALLGCVIPDGQTVLVSGTGGIKTPQGPWVLAGLMGAM